MGATVDLTVEADRDADEYNDELTLLQLEAERELLQAGIDIGQRVTEEVWLLIVQKVDLDADEGMEMWARVDEEWTEKGYPANGEGYPLREFLQELKMELRDREGIKAIEAAVDAAKASLANGETIGETLGETIGADGVKSSVRTMYDKVVHDLDRLGAAAQDAWKLVQEGTVRLSDAEMQAFRVLESAGQQAEFTKHVEDYMLVPPVVNANAGQTAVNQYCIREVKRIVEECRAAGQKWTDPEWDMTTNPGPVLYVDKEQPGYDCTVVAPASYRRLTDIVGGTSKSAGSGMKGRFGSLMGGGPKAPEKPKRPVVFRGGIKAGDIIQGQIGTCFLLGAMGAVASHNPTAVEKLFIKYDVDVGIYGIRFHIEGEWGYVLVDDWFPVDENGALLYSSCHDPEEVWVPLLEKAFCKLHTCYEMCDGGQATEAINAFFGGVGGRFEVKKSHKRRPETYFEVLRHAFEKGWLMTTGFAPGAAGESTGGKCGEPVSDNGLVAGHAYSVLQIVEAHGQKLICCRNPWGQGEWNGKWSDANKQKEWTPEMVKAVGEATGRVRAADGKFWMSIEDFVANTVGVDYARTFGPNWQRTTQYKKFQKAKIVADVIAAHEARDDQELSFEVGDQIEVTSFCSEWWSGKVLGTEKEGVFPNESVEVPTWPVARFDLQGVGAVETADPPMTVVVLLTQPNAMRQRKFTKRRADWLNYKDTSYPKIQLVIVRPDGTISSREEGKRRCVWAEATLSSQGLWRIYALCSDGTGAPFTLRVYMKDGSCTLREVPEATFDEIEDLL